MIIGLLKGNFSDGWNLWKKEEWTARWQRDTESCLPNRRKPCQICNQYMQHPPTHTHTCKNLKAPAKARKRKNETNYISFQAIERVNTKVETCIFIAGHSGTDSAVESDPEWDCEVRKEEAFDTTNWWLLDRQGDRHGPTDRFREQHVVSLMKPTCWWGPLFKITQQLLIWFNILWSHDTLQTTGNVN